MAGRRWHTCAQTAATVRAELCSTGQIIDEEEAADSQEELTSESMKLSHSPTRFQSELSRNVEECIVRYGMRCMRPSIPHQLASATRSQCHTEVWNELSLGRAISPIPSRDN